MVKNISIGLYLYYSYWQKVSPFLIPENTFLWRLQVVEVKVTELRIYVKVTMTPLMQSCIKNLAKHLFVKIVSDFLCLIEFSIRHCYPPFLVQNNKKIRKCKFTNKERIWKCVSVTTFCIPIQKALKCVGMQL